MSESNKKTILSVDDSTVIREMIKGFLKDKFNVVEAGDARECLKILAGTKPKIDLGLIDVEMPGINGFQLIKMIKKHPFYAGVPCLIVTSKDDQNSVKQAVLAGACGYVVKPFSKEALLQKIDEHLKDEPAPVKKEENSAKDKTKPNEGKAETAKDEGGTDNNGDDITDQWEFADE